MTEAEFLAQPFTDVYRAAGQKAALVIVDEVKGFCDVGCGPLAPAAASAQIDRMIAETDRLAHIVGPKIAFRDSHPPGRVEAPYPEHCVQGSGADQFTEKLAWLEDAADTIVIAKDCINGIVGAIQPDGRNLFFDAVQASGAEILIFVGICTDICVLNVVLASLSARTRGFLGAVRDIVVFEPGCATYDFSAQDAAAAGLPPEAAHPAAPYHAMGLLLMRNQGARIASEIEF
jgi:nicotinamidase-related amidase